MISGIHSMVERSKRISTEDEDYTVPDDGRQASIQDSTNDETLDADSAALAQYLSQARGCYGAFFFPVTPIGPPKEQDVLPGWTLDAEVVTKAETVSHSYWHSKRSLFVQIDTPFSVELGLTPLKGEAETRDDLFFRCTAVYDNPEYEHLVVRRCEKETHNHLPVEGALGIVETVEDLAWYCGSGAHNSHYSVVVPMQAPTTTVRYRMTCQTSCSQPGVNRRALALDFTAEDCSGAVYGRNRILVRPCAVPRREFKREKLRLAEKTMERARLTRPEKQFRRHRSRSPCHHLRSPVEQKDTPVDDKTERKANLAKLDDSVMCLLRLKQAIHYLSHNHDKDIVQQIDRVIENIQQKYNLK